MNKEIKEKWVAELRSGKYKQGKSALYDLNSNSYCCLGVLGRVILKHDPKEADKWDGEEYLNEELCEFAGITYDDQQFFARMNDGSPPGDEEFVKPHSFIEIAAYIEREL